MHIATTLVLLTVLGAGSVHAATRTAAGETPGAASLLTAQQRAQDAAQRLRLPAERPAQWKAGGGGWAPAWTPPRRRAHDAPRE